MENFPPPEPVDEAAAAARVDRIAALAARRAASGNATAGTRAATSPDVALQNIGRQRTKRRHPAQGARVAALSMSLASTGGLAALFAVTSPTTGGEIQTAAVVIGPSTALAPATSSTTSPTTSAPAAASVASAAAAPSPTTSSPTTVPATSPTAPAADVVVDGAVFHNKWGDVQVEATFSADGRLIDVAALRTPNDRRKSVQINDYAVPRLTSEALSAQSAKVNTVSGATYTSVDYRNSLQSAIDAAVQAGVVVATA